MLKMLTGAWQLLSHGTVKEGLPNLARNTVPSFQCVGIKGLSNVKIGQKAQTTFGAYRRFSSSGREPTWNLLMKSMIDEDDASTVGNEPAK